MIRSIRSTTCEDRHYDHHGKVAWAIKYVNPLVGM